MGVQEINSMEEFKAALNHTGLVVADFTASWCGPCQMIKPQFHALAEDAANADIKFLSIDVDANADIAEDNDITAMPTFIFFKEGSKVDMVRGASLDSIKAAINKHK